MDLVIKNGTVVSSAGIGRANLYIKDGIIAAISEEDFQAGREIDATGMLIMPGGIDVHTHLDMPFMGTSSTDDFKTGTIAAAYGGNTCIVDYIIPGKSQSLKEALGIWHKKAENKAVIDYGFHMAITPPIDNIITELSEIVDLGITSVKCFFAYKDSLMIDDASFSQLLNAAKRLGMLVCVHAEDGDDIDRLTKQFLQDGETDPVYHALSRPAELEGKSARKIIELANAADAPVYFVHVSTKDALLEILRAQGLGQKIFAETCPQYLLLDQDKYLEKDFGGAKYVMSPPLRDKEHNDYLIGAVMVDNIDVIATDHCPFNFYKEKQLGRDDFTKIPNGIPGIETRLPLMFSELVVKRGLPLPRFVELNCTNPAKIFGILNKGDIDVGMDADIAIWDPEIEWTIENLHHNCDYSPFENYKVTGKPVTVISRGNVIIDQGELLGNYFGGKFIRRKLPEI